MTLTLTEDEKLHLTNALERYAIFLDEMHWSANGYDEPGIETEVKEVTALRERIENEAP